MNKKPNPDCPLCHGYGMIVKDEFQKQAPACPCTYGDELQEAKRSEQPIDSKVPIPDEIVKWIDDWKRKNISSAPSDWEIHSVKATWAAAIAFDLYRHLSRELIAARTQIATQGQNIAELMERLKEVESRAVCRWVKASERLPINPFPNLRFKPFQICYLDANGQMGVLNTNTVEFDKTCLLLKEWNYSWLETIPAEQYNDQVAALLAANKELDEKYVEACRQRDEAAKEAGDYRMALEEMRDTAMLYEDCERITVKVLDQYPQSSKPIE